MLVTITVTPDQCLMALYMQERLATGLRAGMTTYDGYTGQIVAIHSELCLVTIDTDQIPDRLS